MVEVLGGQRNCLLLAAAADHQRDVVPEARVGHRVLRAVVLAVHGRPLALDHREDDLQRLVELVEPVGERAELVAELIVLELEPAGADAQDRAARADHVERGDRLGQQRRVAVGVAGDQGAELDALGGGGQRAQRRVGLQHGLVRRPETGQLVEVVHHEDGVEAGGLGFLGLRHHGGEELFDAGAVGEVRDLIAEFDGHKIDLIRPQGPQEPRFAGRGTG